VNSKAEHGLKTVEARMAAAQARKIERFNAEQQIAAFERLSAMT
jgi:hypothetical protein